MTWLFGLITRNLGMTALGSTGWWAVGLLGAALFAGGAYGGYQLRDLIAQSAENRIWQDNEKRRKDLEQIISRKEQEVLETSQQRRVEYRDRVKEIVKYVDRDNCQFDDIGMQSITCSLRPGSCE